MKREIEIVSLASLMLFGAFVSNAQSANTSLTVSKGVQHVANKKAFEKEKINNSHMEAKTLAFPSIVMSKGMFRSEEIPAQGNIESKGYPTWAISKGVARQQQEQQRKLEVNEFPNKEIAIDTQPISKK